jgi:hypothetical protein
MLLDQPLDVVPPAPLALFTNKLDRLGPNVG